VLRRLGSVGSVGSKGRQANLDSAGRYAGARPATAPAYTHTSGLVVCDRASPRPRAPPRLDIPNGTALDRLSATRQASSQSTEYLNAGGLRGAPSTERCSSIPGARLMAAELVAVSGSRALRSAPRAGARPVVAWRRGPLARSQYHGTADSRVPARPGASSRSAPAPPGTAPRRRRGRRVARASTAMGCQQAGKSRPSTRSASRELGRSLGLARVKGWPPLHSLESRVLSPSMIRACGSIIAARVTCVLSCVRHRPL